MNTAPDAAKPFSGIRSLLFRRWHFSSRVVVVLTLLFLILINLPGNNSLHVSDGNYNSELTQRYEHGWPFTHLSRRERWSPPETMPGMPNSIFPSAEPTVLGCWQFWDLEEQGRFLPYCLLGNVVIGLAVSLLSGGLFEVWRRRRRSLFQFHLVDVGLAVTAIAGVLGWYVSARSIHDREQAALNSYVDERTENGLIRYTMSHNVIKEKRGPTWLRLSLGDRCFEVLDRVVGASPLKNRGVASLAPFRELRKTFVECSNQSELGQVGKFRHLEAFDLTLELRRDAASDDTLVVPPLPNLQVLTIRSYEPRPAGLDGLPSLRRLDLQNAKINVDTLLEISRLQQLRELSVSASGVDRESLQSLKSLTKVQNLNLCHADEMLAPAWLADLPALKSLSFNSSLSEEWLKVINRCQVLESLSVGGLSEKELLLLGGCPRLTSVFVTYSKFRPVSEPRPNLKDEYRSWPPSVGPWETEQLGRREYWFRRQASQVAIEK